MSLIVPCPKCSKKFKVSDDKAGKKIKCSACGAIIAIPASANADDDGDIDPWNLPPSEDPSAPSLPPPRLPQRSSSRSSSPKSGKRSSGSSGSGGVKIVIIVVGSIFLFLVCGGCLIAMVIPAVQQARMAAARVAERHKNDGANPSANAGSNPNSPQPLTKPPANVPPPTVANRFIFRPTFDTTMGEASAGTAFAVTIAGQSRPVILTAIHLLGDSGGLPSEVPPAAVSTIVKSVTLKEVFDDSITVQAGKAIVIPEAGPLSKPSQAGDIVAFWAPEGNSVNTARLAAATPGRETRVWLAAQVVGGADPTTRLHAATVLGIEGDNLVYQYDNPNLELRATSGAPVLNAAGEVVAINLGGLKEGNVLIGVGNPVGRFVPFLNAALKR